MKETGITKFLSQIFFSHSHYSALNFWHPSMVHTQSFAVASTHFPRKVSTSWNINTVQTKKEAHLSHSTSKATCIWSSWTWTNPYQDCQDPLCRAESANKKSDAQSPGLQSKQLKHYSNIQILKNCFVKWHLKISLNKLTLLDKVANMFNFH